MLLCCYYVVCLQARGGRRSALLLLQQANCAADSLTDDGQTVDGLETYWRQETGEVRTMLRTHGS